MFHITSAQVVSGFEAVRVRGLFIAFAVFIAIASAQIISAATYTVTTIGDSGAGSLRQAVLDANATADDDTIVFNIPAGSCSAGVCTITLTTTEITVDNNGSLTIQGTGANVLTIDGGAGTNRIFYSSAATFTLSGATLTGGNGAGANNGTGGAIFANGGTLVLNSVNITGNTAIGGGGVRYSGGTNHQITNSTFSNNNGTNGGCGGFYNINGTLTVTNSTFSGNTTLGYGGGFCNAGTTTVRNSTVTGNTASINGSGIWNGMGTLNIGNSIVAGNGAPADINFESGTAPTTAGYNLIGNNTNVTTQFPAGNPNANNDIVGTSGLPILAELAPLGNYGGTTPTRALCTAAGVPDASCVGASPALDKGNFVAGVTTDQRGLTRPIDNPAIPNAAGGNGSDIGAVEHQFPTAATVSISGRIVNAQGRAISQAQVSLTDMSGNTRTARSSAFGYYSFEDVEVGATYTVAVSSKRFTFIPQVVSVNDNIADLDFTAQ